MRIPIVEIAVGPVQDADIVDPRIHNVHVVDVNVAGVIPGMERFAPTQREPADSASPAATKTEADSKSAAEKADERRPVERPRVNGSRAPTPRPAYKRPSSIVVRRKAPRF